MSLALTLTINRIKEEVSENKDFTIHKHGASFFVHLSARDQKCSGNKDNNISFVMANNLLSILSGQDHIFLSPCYILDSIFNHKNKLKKVRA